MYYDITFSVMTLIMTLMCENFLRERFDIVHNKVLLTEVLWETPSQTEPQFRSQRNRRLLPKTVFYPESSFFLINPQTIILGLQFSEFPFALVSPINLTLHYRYYRPRLLHVLRAVHLLTRFSHFY